MKLLEEDTYKIMDLIINWLPVFVSILSMFVSVFAAWISLMVYSFQKKKYAEDRRVILRRNHARISQILEFALDNAELAFTASQARFSQAGMTDSGMATDYEARLRSEIALIRSHMEQIKKMDPHNGELSAIYIEDSIIDCTSIETCANLLLEKHSRIIEALERENQARSIASRK